MRASNVAPSEALIPRRKLGLSTTFIILVMMATEDRITSIPVHQSTLLALRGVKTAEQTWDDFLMALADDYISPSLRRELDRRLATEEVVSGTAMKREYVRWRRSRGKETGG